MYLYREDVTAERSGDFSSHLHGKIVSYGKPKPGRGLCPCFIGFIEAGENPVDVNGFGVVYSVGTDEYCLIVIILKAEGYIFRPVDKSILDNILNCSL